MRDDIFDKYLADILRKDPPADKDKPQSAVLTEEKAAGPSPATSEDEDIGDFAEKTIRFSKGDLQSSRPEVEEATEPVERPRPRKKKVRKANYSAYGGLVLATLVICVSLVISLFVIVVGRDFLGIDTDNSEFTLYVESGSGIEDVAKMLEENGIIQYPEVFVRFARLKIGGGNIYPGDIDVLPSMSYAEIIDLLTEAREAHATVTVTIPEGTTLDGAAKILEENGVCAADEFIFTFNSSIYGFNFENRVGSSSLKFYKYEGYLFPDTYEFYVGDSAYNIAKKIKTRTDEILNDSVLNRCDEIGLSLDEMMALASILQQESGRPEEMKKISAVFYNRLNHPDSFPRLQSDTTTRYIENVIKSDSAVAYQEMYDAYDTYVCTGLPIGPICNPGLDAIEAALYPEQNDYYYFCSNLETGEFYYAETYDEHLENVERAGLV